MSVTPPVSHVEIWPYVASAAVAFESHATTAVLIVVSPMTPAQLSFCTTPHDVDAHGVYQNAHKRSTSSSTHQPRSWLKAEAE